MGAKAFERHGIAREYPRYNEVTALCYLLFRSVRNLALVPALPQTRLTTELQLSFSDMEPQVAAALRDSRIWLFASAERTSINFLHSSIG